MRKLIYLAFIVAVLGAGSAWGCMCPYAAGSIEDLVRGALETSSSVFLGEVVGYEYRAGLMPEPYPVNVTAEEAEEKEVRVVKFKIDRWWKMPLPAETLLITGSWRDKPRASDLLPSEHVSMCELPLIKGEKYLIYASGPADKLRNRVCSRTAPIGRADDDLKVLGKGRKPVRK